MTTTETRTAASQLAQPSLLYVSTELETWETTTPGPDQDEVCERCGFRRLDPEYYAWLRHRMTVAQHFRRSGRLSAAQYQTWRARFNAIHAWAITRFGESVLISAVETLDPKGYDPPRIEDWEPAPRAEPAVTPPHIYPAGGAWSFTESVAPEGLAKVDAIREQALTLGWTEAGLYQNRGRYRFPVGGDYGVVCFLHSEDQIGEITAHFIEIVRPNGSRLRYYNRAASRPLFRSNA
ncbi:MAG: hypothetical protein ACE149_19915 [Armatimonadota bacterium]